MFEILILGDFLPWVYKRYDMKDFINDIFKSHNITEWGVCDYSDVLPTLECRAKARIPTESKSVIVCLFPYYVGECEGRNLSRYAVISDYHKVAGDILSCVCERLRTRFNAEFEPFVDSSPISEVKAAVLSGVGFVGKNSLLINPHYGSYVFIAEIVTNLKIPKDSPCESACLNCGACADACVGGAISDGDFTKCASFISQKKGDLTDEEKSILLKSSLVWGCDRCSDACPYNKSPKKTPITQFYENIVWSFTGQESDEFISSRAYGWRGRKVLERNLLILKE